MYFGVLLEVNFVKQLFWGGKVSAIKQTEKQGTPKVKQRVMVVAQGSQTAHPKVKD